MRVPCSPVSRLDAGAPISRQALLVATAASLAGLSIQPTFAGPPSLKAKLDARDSSLLTKPSGGAPPGEAVFPAWMAGEWKVRQSFAGYELPAKDKIDRAELFAEADVPGFKKCSIALLPDVGKEGVSFPMRWAADSSGLVREDRVFNYRAATRGGLGYDAIERIDYKVATPLPTHPSARPHAHHQLVATLQPL